MIVQRTHQGLVRQINQDTIFSSTHLCAVADGMGGHNAGEIASAVAVELLAHFQHISPNRVRIEQIFQLINSAIFSEQQAKTHLSGMGTTLTCFWIGEGILWVGHVGDSRCYVVRGNQITQLTQDHSYVGRMVREHKLTEEEARTSPYRHYIDRALGLEPAVKVDAFSYRFKKDDVFLLCSDGLSSMLSNQTILDCIQQHSASQALDILFEQAQLAGASDNISAIIFDTREGIA